MSSREFHPFGEFIPDGANSMIIGSFPIGKFSDPKRKNEIKKTEIDFFFGGERNLLWKILSEVFERPLNNRDQIINLLSEKNIAFGDVIKSCVRRGGRASDSDLEEIEWNRNLITVIEAHQIHRLYFTSRKVERWFKMLFSDISGLELISLLSPSGQTARSIVRIPNYQKELRRNPNMTTFEYLVQSYKEVFK